jgi:FkbM family methyltransferase
MNPHLQEVHDLLSEDVGAAQQRERTTFDQQAAPLANSLVLFGSGKFGRSILRRLRGFGIAPLAFCDNNSRLWSQRVDGLEVLSPADAVRVLGSRAVFVVTIWSDVVGHPLEEITRQLQSHGPVKVVSFIPLFWKYSKTFLPYFGLDLPHKIILQKKAVLEAAQLWGDPQSQQEYVGQLRWRLRADISGVMPRSVDAPFFQPSLLTESSDEVFVDCGAYDGDTLRVLLGRGIGQFKRIIALEPDPANYAKLRVWIDTLDGEVRSRVTSFPVAVGASRGTLRFAATGTEQSKASDSGSLEIQCAKLDELVADFSPTYIKMDIEGAELDAVKGAQSIVQGSMPVLAVSAYHEPAHLWQLPLLIRSLIDGYTFALRPHAQASWDLMCYAIPPSRLPKKRAPMV